MWTLSLKCQIVLKLRKKYLRKMVELFQLPFAVWDEIYPMLGKKIKVVASSSADKFMPYYSNFFALKLILHQDMKTIKKLF